MEQTLIGGTFGVKVSQLWDAVDSCGMNPSGDLICHFLGLLVFHSWSMEGTLGIYFEMSR